MHKTRPVTFNIPAGQPIETTSISSFRGIQYSDNPLNVDPDSASDMLNVYLNDSGTLTTRPRIEFEKKYTNMGKILNKVKLSDTMNFYQSLDENLVKLWIETDEVYLVTLGEQVIQETKVSAFLKDDKIYVLAGDNYYVIKNINGEYILYNVVDDVDTKIPTTKTMTAEDSIGGSDTSYSKNLLSTEYASSVIWDGKTDISSLLVDSSGVENNYFEKSEGFYTIGGAPSEQSVWTEPVRGEDCVTYSIRNGTGSQVFILRRTEDNIETHVYGMDYVYVRCSPNGRFLFGTEYDGDKIALGKIDDETNTLSFYRTTDSDYMSAAIDNDGFIYALVSKEDSLYLRKYRMSGDDNLTMVGSDLFISNRFAYMPAWSIQINRSCSKLLISIWGSSSNSEPVEEKIFLFEIATGYLIEVLSDEHRIGWNYSENFTYRVSGSALTSEKAVLQINELYKDPSSGVFRYNKHTSQSLTITNRKYDVEQRFYISENGSVYVVAWDPKTTDSSPYRLSLSFVPNTYDKIYEIYDIGYNMEIGNSFDSENLNFFVFERYPYTTSRKNVWFVDFKTSLEPQLKIYYKYPIGENSVNPNYYCRFQNNYWFYGNSNRLYYTSLNDPTYIEEHNYIDVGDDLRITGLAVLGDNLLACYKENELFLITRVYLSDELGYGYVITETKGDVGNIPIGQNITTKYSELPLSFDNSGIFTISQVKNVTLSEHTTASLSSNIDKILLAEPNKETILTHNHRYWTYVIFPGETSKVYVLDNRTNEWYYWELPHSKIVSLWEEDEIGSDGLLYVTTKYITEDGSVYALRIVDSVVQIDAINSNDYYTEYSDTFENQKEEIKWFWQSQILPLTFSKYSKSYPALGYRKQLIQTGFLFTDTDENEEYSLQYKFNVFRKNLSSVGERSISGTLNRVRSILKRTYIPRLNFLQIRIENSETDFVPQTNLPNTHNKLNLIQLKFKYKLMEEGV